MGLGSETATFLAGSVFNTLLYFLPVLAGTVVDRFGFKRSLMACFGIFSLGYFLIGLGGLPLGQPLVQAVGPKAWMLMALVVTAIGGSLIKPSIVGTVARTTTDETKALGYSIYYTLVNIGGAVGPFIALAVRESLGISYVLVVSSLTSLVLFGATTAFYREPPRAADAPPARSMARVLADMVLVFGNLRFILFLVIFSGFWAMFWHVFYALPFYVKDFLQFPRFEMIESVGRDDDHRGDDPRHRDRPAARAHVRDGPRLRPRHRFLVRHGSGAHHRRHGGGPGDLRAGRGPSSPRATTSTWPPSPRPTRWGRTWASPSSPSRSAPSSPAGRAGTW